MPSTRRAHLSPVLSIRSGVVFLALGAALVLGAGCSRSPDAAARPEAGAALRQAVDATIGAGSARVQARLTPVSGGSAVVVEGVTSFVDSTARMTATTLDDPHGPSAEVRVTPAGSWIRVTGSPVWVTVSPAMAQATPALSWGHLFADVAAGTDARWADDLISVVVDGRAATIRLDPSGRIVEIQIPRSSSSFVLTLSDFGTEVDVVAP